MKYKVLNKQNNSESCLVCGLVNTASLKANFYEIDNNMLVAVVTCKNIHQSFPGRVHGGIISALLDEVVGRAAQIGNPDLWAVTGELNVRFKKPVPLNQPIKVVGKIIKDGNRSFIGCGFIEDDEGIIYATTQATYVKLPINVIAGGEFEKEWFNNPEKTDPTEIDVINNDYFDNLNI